MSIDEKIDNETFFELSALFLSLNRKTFEAMASLKEFHNLSKHFTEQRIENLDALYHLQHTIINYMLEHRSKNPICHLHDSFSYLQNEGLIDKLSFEKLISLFDPSILNEDDDKEISIEGINKNFHVDKQAILEDIAQLRTLFNKSDELESVVEYLNNQKFSIGITGVMNAGKSTMLNALMGEEILGTSVVPETANLSVVKYSKTPLAKVVYWNQSEWQNIEHSSHSIDAIASFVKQTKKEFKNLDEFILPESREDKIDIKELSNYTSANQSNKKSNLVKYVELGTPLSFLEDAIEIVDTPGLDDIVVQREEITKEYLSKCDVMIHLMNVSQSATQKDIDFIIDAVLYQNISKVLVVITRIDTVSSQDVDEVIAYTKESIARKMHEQNSGSKLDFVLKTLHFIALSGKMALLHKTGRAEEAKNAGYSIEKTGILEVENYLQETLFSNKSARSSLIIRSAKNRLSRVIDKVLQELKFESSLIFKTEEEVDAELALLKAKKQKQLETLNSLKYQIIGYEAEVTNYLERLQHFLKNELKALQTIIKQRLLDETYYSLEKYKKAPKERDQRRIIETALKHGVVDIIREYRYKFIKKSSKIFESISLQYDELGKTDENIYESFDHQTIFNDAFKQGFLTANNSALIHRVSKVLGSASLSKFAKIDDEISKVIREEFIYLEEQVKTKALNLSQRLLKDFFKSLQVPIDTFESSLENSEKLLLGHIVFLKEDEVSRSDKSKELHVVIKSIETIAKRYTL